MKTLLATFVLALALVPAAMAASSSVDGYGGVGGAVQDNLGGDPSAVAADDTRSAEGTSIPFTGYDALAIGGVGLLLAGVGVSLRLSQRRAGARGLIDTDLEPT